ncbi:MAG: hypothetical protein NC405_04435 [Odoribacter sp.]|nr:hypothetical protein [Odoribacter sp.]
MTSANLTPQQIRQLLELYYSGDSTPSQEAALTRYFLTHKCVEPDLEADRRMFVAMSQASLPPKDLERRIIMATSGKKKHLLSHAWRIAASITLLMLLAATAIIFKPKQTGNPNIDATEEVGGLISAFICNPDTLLRVDTIKPAKPEKMLAMETPRPSSSQATHYAKTKPAKESRVIIVSDSVEAAQLLQMVNGTISRSLAGVSTGINSTRQTFQEVENTINKKLR